MAYRLAIIGLGGMGSWHAANIAEKVPEIKVTGAFDVREEALEKARSMGLKAYSSLDELLGDPDVDIVTIATPNDFHKDIAIAAMRAGKNVVCEKPVTLNADELRQVISVRDETRRLFSVHQNRRWDKDYRVVKAAVESGLLGDVYMIESKVHGSRKSLEGWRGHKRNGGGMLYDWGVHLIDQMLMLKKSAVVEAEAHLLSIFTPEVDDNIKLLLRFEDGCSASLEMATNSLVPAPRWHVQGTGGTLQIDDWSAKGRLMRLKQDAAMTWEDDIVYTEAGPTRTMAPRPDYTMEELPLPEVKTDWADYYRNIAATLDGSAELIVKPEEALRVMTLIDALFASAAEGRSVRCHI